MRSSKDSLVMGMSNDSENSRSVSFARAAFDRACTALRAAAGCRNAMTPCSGSMWNVPCAPCAAAAMLSSSPMASNAFRGLRSADNLLCDALTNIFLHYNTHKHDQNDESDELCTKRTADLTNCMMRINVATADSEPMEAENRDGAPTPITRCRRFVVMRLTASVASC